MRKRLPCDQIQAGLLRLLLKSSKVYSVLSDRQVILDTWARQEKDMVPKCVSSDAGSI